MLKGIWYWYVGTSLEIELESAAEESVTNISTRDRARWDGQNYDKATTHWTLISKTGP